MKIKDILEALPPSYYRSHVQDFRSGNTEPQAALAELFQQSKMHKDRNAYRLIVPYQTEREVSVPPEIETYLKDSGYRINDYQSGTATDKYGRLTKIGKALKKEPRLLNMFNTDESRSGKGETRYAVISRHPSDIVAMSTGQGWTSCMNLDIGTFKKHVKYEVTNGSVVAYEFTPKNNVSDTVVHKMHGGEYTQPRSKMMITMDGKNIRGIATGRILFKLFENQLSYGDYKFNMECVYGTPTEEFVNIAEDWVEWANDILTANGTKSGFYKLQQGSYQDSVGSIMDIGSLPRNEEGGNILIDYITDSTTDSYERENILAHHMDLIELADPSKIYWMIDVLQLDDDDEMMENLEPRIFQSQDIFGEYVENHRIHDANLAAQYAIKYDNGVAAYQVMEQGPLESIMDRYLEQLLLLAIDDGYVDYDWVMEEAFRNLDGPFDMEFFKKLMEKSPYHALENYMTQYYAGDGIPDDVMEVIKKYPHGLVYLADNIVEDRLEPDQEAAIAKSPHDAKNYARSLFLKWDDVPDVIKKSIMSDSRVAAGYIEDNMLRDTDFEPDEDLVRAALDSYKTMLSYVSKRNPAMDEVLKDYPKPYVLYIQKVIHRDGQEFPYDMMENLYRKDKILGKNLTEVLLLRYVFAMPHRLPKYLEKAILDDVPRLRHRDEFALSKMIANYIKSIGKTIPEFVNVLDDDDKARLKSYLSALGS